MRQKIGKGFKDTFQSWKIEKGKWNQTYVEFTILFTPYLRCIPATQEQKQDATFESMISRQ